MPLPISPWRIDGACELIFLRGLAPPPTVIFYRLPPRDPGELAASLVTLLGDHALNANCMVVVTEQGIRRRRFPSLDLAEGAA